MLKPFLFSCLLLVSLPNLVCADAKVSGFLNIETGGGIAFSDGTLTSAAGITGPQGDPGPQGAPGPTSIANCPAGMTKVDLQYTTVCYDQGVTGTWDQADNYCDNNFRARICSLQEWRDVVCRAGVSNPGRSWTPSPAGTATFATIAGCTGDGIASASYTTMLKGPCCLSWPRY